MSEIRALREQVARDRLDAAIRDAYEHGFTRVVCADQPEAETLHALALDHAHEVSASLDARAAIVTLTLRPRVADAVRTARARDAYLGIGTTPNLLEGGS